MNPGIVDLAERAVTPRILENLRALGYLYVAAVNADGTVDARFMPSGIPEGAVLAAQGTLENLASRDALIRALLGGHEPYRKLTNGRTARLVAFDGASATYRDPRDGEDYHVMDGEFLDSKASASDVALSLARASA